MDLRLFLRVLWRFRLLILVGSCVALGLTFLSMVRVSPGGSPTFAYRNSETWIATSRIFVTEPGFPWGRRLIAPLDSGPPSKNESDPGRFTGLAVLYSNLANTDPVRRILLKGGPFKSKITASPVPGNSDGDPLPIIAITASGGSRREAIVNTKRATSALVTFIQQQQEVNKIAADDRVVLETIETPKKATLFAGRPKVLPIFVFVFVMGLVIGLTLLLENLRPMATPTEIRADEQADPATRLRMPA